MIRFGLIALVTFVLMEGVSYLVHRFLYHGMFWSIHRSHHTPREGSFELNDVFPVFFAGVSILLMVWGILDFGSGAVLACGIGITAYGLVYFLIHDLYIHRRVKSVSLRIPFLLQLKKAHAIHHRYGGEPYGLLFFLWRQRMQKEQVTEEEII